MKFTKKALILCTLAVIAVLAIARINTLSVDKQSYNQLLMHLANDARSDYFEMVEAILPGYTFVMDVDDQSNMVYVDYKLVYGSEEYGNTREEVKYILFSGGESTLDIEDYSLHYSDFKKDSDLRLRDDGKWYLVSVVFTEKHKAEWSDIPNITVDQVFFPKDEDGYDLTYLSSNPNVWLALMKKGEYDDNDIIYCYNMLKAREAHFDISQHIDDYYREILSFNPFPVFDMSAYQETYFMEFLPIKEFEMYCLGFVMQGDYNSIVSFIRNAQACGFEVEIARVIKSINFR